MLRSREDALRYTGGRWRGAVDQTKGEDMVKPELAAESPSSISLQHATLKIEIPDGGRCTVEDVRRKESYIRVADDRWRFRRQHR